MTASGTDQAGKVAIVTGAGAGIGRAEAQRLAADGAAIVVNDFDSAAAEETAEFIRGSGGQAAFAGKIENASCARIFICSASSSLCGGRLAFSLVCRCSCSPWVLSP